MSSGWESTTTPVWEEERATASWLPLIAAIACIPVSLLLLMLSSAQVDTATGSRLIFGLAGYITTPLATAGCLVWAIKSHRSHIADENYKSSSGERVIKACGIVAALGFLVGVAQILIVADAIAILLGGGV